LVIPLKGSLLGDMLLFCLCREIESGAHRVGAHKLQSDAESTTAMHMSHDSA